MRDWDKHLPKRMPDPEKMPNGIMLRPNENLVRWIMDRAKTHRISMNKFALAVLEAAMEHDNKLRIIENQRIKDKVGPSPAEQIAAALENEPHTSLTEKSKRPMNL